MSQRMFVIDTSYLLELFKVGKDWDEDAHTKIKEKFSEEQQAGSQFYFPIPVLFEFANHIADAKNRSTVIKNFNGLIEQCLDDELPFFITPCSNADSVSDFIKDLCRVINRFSDEFVQQQLGLTDVSIITECEHLKKQYKVSNCKIHIWTRHQALKAREQDSELNAFVL
ncbi:MAG: hypothetical protein Q9M50_14675 [Methylococcales bacterium]|nr:hypothetical protein [Methylococcales bacterium]